MAINIYTDQMQYAQLFGRPVLTTNWIIPRETVPDGWYCYDMRGTDADPGSHAALVDYTSFLHSGTVLSHRPLKRPSTDARRIGKGDYFLHGEEMDLERFCEEYNLDYPENPIKFEMRPASPDEAGIFYALPPEKDEELGAVGHVRIDFGENGHEFWHTWWPRGSDELNTPEFREELGQVVDQLRRGVLKDLTSMDRWCFSHGGKIDGGWDQNYGYVVETERYRYCLRCNPVLGDYQAYLTCFDKQAQQMGLTKQGRQALQDAADPDKPHSYRWYVIENILKGENRVDHELPLEEAVQLYIELDGGDKRLGVTKDDITSVDLAVTLSGWGSFPEDWKRLDSFAQDEVVAEAAAQIQQALEGLAVGRVSFANEERFIFTDPQEYVAAIHKELPYHTTSGFRYETLTDDLATRRAVDVEVYDMFGMEPPWQEADSADEHQPGPEEAETMKMEGFG